MSARFVTSSPDTERLPDLGFPEFAFAGRSNVGKSTLVAQLLRRQGLVRTSRTPGRTQLLNMFVYEERLTFVDLPGYGYAKLSKQQRRELEVMVQGYLRDRKNLHGVIMVVDARRLPVSPHDLAVAKWVANEQRRLVLAVTKIDLIPKNKRLGQARSIQKAFAGAAESFVLCSGKSGEGRDELFKQMRVMSEPEEE